MYEIHNSCPIKSTPKHNQSFCHKIPYTRKSDLKHRISSFILKENHIVSFIWLKTKDFLSLFMLKALYEEREQKREFKIVMIWHKFGITFANNNKTTAPTLLSWYFNRLMLESEKEYKHSHESDSQLLLKNRYHVKVENPTRSHSMDGLALWVKEFLSLNHLYYLQEGIKLTNSFAIPSKASLSGSSTKKFQCFWWLIHLGQSSYKMEKEWLERLDVDFNYGKSCDKLTHYFMLMTRCYCAENQGVTMRVNFTSFLDVAMCPHQPVSRRCAFNGGWPS